MSAFTNPNHGSNQPGQSKPESGLDQTKAQVDEVVVIMKQNVDKGKYLCRLQKLDLSYIGFLVFA